MTKKIFPLVLLLTATTIFTDCKREEDDIFNRSAAERLNDVKSVYSDRLTANTAGWAMEYYPQVDEEAYKASQCGYLMLAKFKKDQTVDMAMNYWPEWYLEQGNGDQVRFKEQYFSDENTLWEIITDNGPVLSFNSYNEVMHHFSNPEMYAQTEGYGGDYEFTVMEAPEDGSHILLKGKKRGTYNMMTPLPAGTDFKTYLDDVLAFQNATFVGGLPYSPIINIGEQKYVFADAVTRFPTIYPVDSDRVVTGKHIPFVVRKTENSYRLRFRDAISFDEGKTKAQIFDYNREADEFVDVENAANKISVSETAAPFFFSNIKNGHTFRIYRSGSKSIMSEKMQGLFNDASDALHVVNSKYQVDSLTLSYQEKTDKFVWAFKYNVSGKTYSCVYSVNIDGDKASFAYSEADMTADDVKFLNNAKLTKLKQFIAETLAQQFLVEKYQTVFDLSKIKFTAVNDPELWFVVYY